MMMIMNRKHQKYLKISKTIIRMIKNLRLRLMKPQTIVMMLKPETHKKILLNMRKNLMRQKLTRKTSLMTKHLKVKMKNLKKDIPEKMK